MKSISFIPYFDLPAATGERLELSLGSPSAPRADLEARGWNIVDPRVSTKHPWSYQDYLRASKGEFSVAKHGYVMSRSGWFSERTCAYLASARPAVVQDTGFTEWLPTGRGLHAFTNPSEAAEAMRRVSLNYLDECRAARAIVEQYFDARSVLARLLEHVS